MTDYATHMLPKYVTDWFGKPLTLKRTIRGHYVAEGSKRTLRFEAETVDDARRLLRKHAAYESGLKDGRVERWRR